MKKLLKAMSSGLAPPLIKNLSLLIVLIIGPITRMGVYSVLCSSYGYLGSLNFAGAWSIIIDFLPGSVVALDGPAKEQCFQFGVKELKRDGKGRGLRVSLLNAFNFVQSL